MSNIDIVLSFLIAAGGIALFTLSLIILTSRNKKRFNYLSFLIFFHYGGAMFCDLTYRPGTAFLTPHLLYVNYPLVFFLAPLTYIYLGFILNEKFQLRKKHIFLFVPGFIIVLVLFPFFILDAAAKLSLYPLSIDAYIHSSPSIIILISFLFSLKSTFFLWNKTAMTHIKIIRSVLLYVGAWIVLGGIFVLASVTKNLFLYRMTALTGNGMMFLWFIFIYRDPEFFYKSQRESRKIKYLNSRLKGLNEQAILRNLDILMIQEQIYKQSTLSLKELSRKLNIRPDQLSEILNKNHNSNFNFYINTYRIEQIKKELLENPEGNILHMAFNSGFNSKTTFNTAFLKNTGMSPSKYRKIMGTGS